MVRCVLGGASTACPRYSIITVGRKQLANRRRHVPDSGKMFSGVTLSTRAVEDRQIGSSICPCAGVVLPMLAYHHDAASAVVCDIRVWQRPVVVDRRHIPCITSRCLAMFPTTRSARIQRKPFENEAGFEGLGEKNIGRSSFI